MEQRYQVIIVGGGPVGVALAVDLGIRGIHCALIERHLLPQRIPKGQNLTHRSLEHFYHWGVVDELRAARVLPNGYPIGGITAYRDLQSDYWFAPVGRESLGSYYFQANDRLPQYLTEEVLRRRLSGLPNVTTMFGWSAGQIEQNDDGVRVAISEEGGSGKHTLEAEYLVGCDGTHSSVREQLGIGLEGTDFDQRMVLLVFRSRELHEGLKRFPERTTYRVLHPEHKGIWQFFGRIDVGEGWFFHAPVPSDATAENYDFEALLNRAGGFDFSCTFDHIGFWDLRVATANTYRKGRAFIAGDAAHSHPPYGGYGLNTGLEDAANLGWKLAAALEGWGGETLLDSYTDERRPVFWETGESVIVGGVREDRKILEGYSPDKGVNEFEDAWRRLQEAESSVQRSYEPHYDGSPVIVGALGSASGALGEHSFAARAGHHLGPQRLSSGLNVFEELDHGFTLLAFGVDDVDIAPIENATKSLNMPLKMVRDTYEGDRKAFESRLVLVRPDQFVAWASDESPRDAAALMRSVAGIS